MGRREGRKGGEGGRDPGQAPPHTPARVWPAVLTEKEPQKKVRWAVGGAFTTHQPPDLEQVTLSLAFASWENWAGAGQGAGGRAEGSASRAGSGRSPVEAAHTGLCLSSLYRAASSEVSPTPHQ